jgi:putative DeoR family transcriptional regulator (stage III sporulation protein D)
MRDNVYKKVLLEGEYIVENKTTIRKTAKHFNCGKSTVHKDITKKLKWIDYELYKQVREVLNLNLSERHIRGGESTKLKFKGRKQ